MPIVCPEACTGRAEAAIGQARGTSGGCRGLTSIETGRTVSYMTTNLPRIDWILCLAWSLGHAILTALVGRTAVNADVTYDSIRATGSRAPNAQRWVGRCKTCRKAHRVDGVLADGHAERRHDQIIVAGSACYLTSCNGTDPSGVWVACCSTRARLSRVYDSHKPNRPRHECNAKCLASTGPACECKCGGKNHGAGHR